uniref:Cytochrome B subunit of succinate dehydrogenase n=1 Tax=Mycena chlorophos TaxID=658473 RepID=A0ABQ0MAA7_MYCCL|nr:cytochrome B subunit of succinate dehydrogenase [Mycena chlorophos]
MMSIRAVGLGAPMRQATLSRALARSPVVLAKRNVQTESQPPSAAIDILNKQRLRRPTSPHMTIYQWQMTWIPSIVHRMTGGALSGLLYGFSLAYLVAPGTFDSAHIVEFVAGLPDVVKYAGKAFFAAPLLFHSFNGVRHLSWDMIKFMNVKGMYQTGYTVLAATAIGTVGLVLM